MTNHLKALSALALACAGTFAGLAMAQPMSYVLPPETAVFKPGPEVEAAENNCAACHSADYILTQPPKMGRSFWDAEIHKMISAYGAPIDEKDAKAIVDYLAATY